MGTTLPTVMILLVFENQATKQTEQTDPGFHVLEKVLQF
jgi:hypothetical protein